MGSAGGDLPGGQGEHLLAAEHLARKWYGVRGAVRPPRLHALRVAREHFEALQGARRHQETAAFRASYAARAGIEGTHAQAVRRCGLRRCRYVGLAKTHLQHVITAAAVNLVRVAEWFAGTPVAKTRCSRFAALQLAA